MRDIFYQEMQENVDAKEKNETIDNAKQTILIPS